MTFWEEMTNPLKGISTDERSKVERDEDEEHAIDERDEDDGYHEDCKWRVVTMTGAKPFVEKHDGRLPAGALRVQIFDTRREANEECGL